MSKIEAGLRKANAVLADIGTVCLVCLTLLIAVNVMMRYFLNAPIDWADEFSAYFLLGIIFFGAAYALHEGAHIKIDFLVVLLPQKLRRILSLAVHCVGVFFATLLLLGAYSRVKSFWVLNTQSMGEFAFPLYLPALTLIVGCGMFLLVMVTKTIQLLADIMSAK